MYTGFIRFRIQFNVGLSLDTFRLVERRGIPCVQLPVTAQESPHYVAITWLR